MSCEIEKSGKRCDEPQIGDVDEGIVERGEDTGNAENELACKSPMLDMAM